MNTQFQSIQDDLHGIEQIDLRSMLNQERLKMPALLIFRSQSIAQYQKVQSFEWKMSCFALSMAMCLY